MTVDLAEVKDNPARAAQNSITDAGASEASGKGVIAQLRTGQGRLRRELGATARGSTATAGSTFSSITKDRMNILDRLENEVEENESKILIKGNNR